MIASSGGLRSELGFGEDMEDENREVGDVAFYESVTSRSKSSNGRIQGDRPGKIEPGFKP